MEIAMEDNAAEFTEKDYDALQSLMASQLQYMGRLLGVADCPKKYWPWLMVNSLLMAGIGMMIMRFLV